MRFLVADELVDVALAYGVEAWKEYGLGEDVLAVLACDGFFN
jgi:hypothetical protein